MKAFGVFVIICLSVYEASLSPTYEHIASLFKPVSSDHRMTRSPGAGCPCFCNGYRRGGNCFGTLTGNNNIMNRRSGITFQPRMGCPDGNCRLKRSANPQCPGGNCRRNPCFGGNCGLYASAPCRGRTCRTRFFPEDYITAQYNNRRSDCNGGACRMKREANPQDDMENFGE